MSIDAPQARLEANSRARFAALIAFVLLDLAALGAVIVGIFHLQTLWWLIPVGLFLSMLAAPLVFLFVLLSMPRVEIGPTGVRFNLGLTNNCRHEVPLEAVECFFPGVGPSEIIGDGGHAVNARHLVVRLAEKAIEWQAGQADQRIAKWCGGYITIYGMWCEPLNPERVAELNHALAEAKRAAKLKQS